MSSMKNIVSPSLLALSLGAALLSGCNKSNDGAQASSPSSTAPAPASTAVNPQSSVYTPPTAVQLSQLVAPIAIFPDKLVAQVLAGSTYPDQIEAAYQWQQQNASLKGAALQNAVDTQPWDESIKGLTTFPEVLHQMASNLPWTTALGDAYVHDPADVMNEIQTLRQLAMAAGNLKSDQCMNVRSVPRSSMPPPPATFTHTNTLVDNGPPVYSGPAVVPEPQQVIEIEPADPSVVYVPAYNPTVIYGSPIAVYPGYVYEWPRPIYTGRYYGDIAFGLGISIGLGFGHPWGWGAWGVNWGWHPGWGWGHGGPGWRPGPGWGYHGPAVVYNHNTYISHSTTVINHINNGFNANNRYAGLTPGAGGGFSHAPAAMAGAAIGAAAMHGAFANRAMNTQMQAAMAQHAAMRPDFTHINMPHFSNAMATPGFRGASGVTSFTHTHPMAAAGLGAAAGAAAIHSSTANMSMPHFNSGATTVAGTTSRNAGVAGGLHAASATVAHPHSFAATSHPDMTPSFAAQERNFASHAATSVGETLPQDSRESAYQSTRPSYRNSFQPQSQTHSERTYAQRSSTSRDLDGGFNRPNAPAYHSMSKAPHSYSMPRSYSSVSHGGGHASAPHGGGNHRER